MKYLFLSLLLLSTPALADNTFSNQQCQQMYHAIVIDLETNRTPSSDMMTFFGATCIQTNTTASEDMEMVKAVLSRKMANAIKAKLAEQDIIKL